MKAKRLLAGALTVVFLSSSIALADVEETDINYFLEKIATTENEAKRNLGVWFLDTYMNNDSPDLDGLKTAIGKSATESDLSSIEERGYTINQAIDSLDVLGEMDREEIGGLIEAIENQDMDEMKNILSGHVDAIKETGGGEIPEPAIGTGTGLHARSYERAVIRESSFSDTKEHWAGQYIKYLADRGIINGKSEKIFDPQATISRAEFTALIVRLFNIEEVDEGSEFADIAETDWFRSSVLAAKAAGIISGTDEKHFAPQSAISREQATAVIMRALGASGKEIEADAAEEGLEAFIDQGSISAWARQNLGQAVSMGFINGRNNAELSPQGILTRAESAVIIKRIYDYLTINEGEGK